MLHIVLYTKYIFISNTKTLRKTNQKASGQSMEENMAEIAYNLAVSEALKVHLRMRKLKGFTIAMHRRIDIHLHEARQLFYQYINIRIRNEERMESLHNKIVNNGKDIVALREAKKKITD